MTELRLKVSDGSDTSFFNGIRNDASNAKVLNWSSWSPESEEATRSYIQSKSGSLYTIMISDDSKVGYVQLKTGSCGGENYHEPEEVGVYLLPSARGKGYAERALLLLESCSQSSLGLMARVDSRNEASSSLFRRVGYHEVGRIDVLDRDTCDECCILYFFKRL